MYMIAVQGWGGGGEKPFMYNVLDSFGHQGGGCGRGFPPPTVEIFFGNLGTKYRFLDAL